MMPDAIHAELGAEPDELPEGHLDTSYPACTNHNRNTSSRGTAHSGTNAACSQCANSGTCQFLYKCGVPFLGLFDLVEDRQFARTVGALIVASYGLLVWLLLSVSVSSANVGSETQCNETVLSPGEEAVCTADGNATTRRYGLALARTLRSYQVWSEANVTVFDVSLCWGISQASEASVCLGYSTQVEDYSETELRRSVFEDGNAIPDWVLYVTFGLFLLTLLAAPLGNSALLVSSSTLHSKSPRRAHCYPWLAEGRDHISLGSTSCALTSTAMASCPSGKRSSSRTAAGSTSFSLRSHAPAWPRLAGFLHR